MTCFLQGSTAEDFIGPKKVEFQKDIADAFIKNMKAVVCPTCRIRYTDDWEKEFIENASECSNCDRARLDVLDDLEAERGDINER